MCQFFSGDHSRTYGKPRGKTAGNSRANATARSRAHVAAPTTLTWSASTHDRSPTSGIHHGSTATEHHVKHRNRRAEY